MSGPRYPIGSEDEALLCAFLDGELPPADEAHLLERLAQDSALQDALDALAADLALTHRAMDALAPVDDAEIAAGVMAAIDPAGVSATVAGATTLASLVVDGAATAAQADRLAAIATAPSADARLADAVAGFVAAVDVARAGLVVDDLPAVAPSLAMLPEHVGARVERTERAWALVAGAVEGALSPAEADELCGLCAANVLPDDGPAGDAFGAAVLCQRRALYVGEALRAASDSPAFARLAARAGDAALQVISSAAAQRAAPERALPPTTRVASSWWAQVRAMLVQGLAPLAAASAAVFLFALVRAPEPATSPTADGTRLAELQRLFVDAVGPAFFADHTVILASLPGPLLPDNAAEVQAIDATSTTMVFETPESHITVIWVAGLDEGDVDGHGIDDAGGPEEQGT